ncbi:MAG: DoxX family protein, partial [Phyllobacterium sp.]
MDTNGHNRPLIIPALGGLYRALGEFAETLLRVVAGGLLVVHGSAKIVDPFGAAGMVEGLGFYPGVFWSPLLSATEFFGGILLVLGLFTRPAALATTIVLAVTVYFQWIVQGQGM